MAVDVNQLAQQDQAFLSQASDARNAKAAQEKLQPDDSSQPQSFVQKWITGPIGRVSTSMMDSAMSAAETAGASPDARHIIDVATGAMTGAVNTADSVVSLGKKIRGSGTMAAEQDPNDAEALENPPMPTSPVWDHAKGAILDFRDAIAVQDPQLDDRLVQAGAQLAIPFMGYSRALAGLHGVANMVAAGAVTDATALAPHDGRMADMLALGRHTEGKFGDTLRAMAPDGSLQNAYINYLTDRTNETEAEGRFKNVLDGFGTNILMTPLLAAAASTLKYGTAGIRYAIDNGVGSAGDLMSANPASQGGKIVFHGTASDFDHFDSSKIGSGEGNQAFGHGLYFAENPEVAGHYQSMLAKRNMGIGADIQDAKQAVKSQGSPARAYKSLIENAADEADPVQRQRLQRLAQLVKSGNYTKGGGNLMHVDIPDEHINNMVDWDKPISEQPNLQNALKDLNVTIEPGPNRDFQVMVNGKPGPRYLSRAAAMAETDLLRGDAAHGTVDAGMGYRQLSEALRGDKQASQYLSSKGIPGIKFLDGSSRQAGNGSRNIVLFDAKHAKIVKKE